MQPVPNLHHGVRRDALKLSFGFDLGGKDLLQERRVPVLPNTKRKEHAGEIP